jgi:hypothetical protein
MVAHREQALGCVQAGLDTKLVGREAKDGLELPDEMKWRDLHLAREVRIDGEGSRSSRSRSRAWQRRRNPSCLSSIVLSQCTQGIVRGVSSEGKPPGSRDRDVGAAAGPS